jgi:putative endonuclease
MSNHLILGKNGEEAATKFLKEKGYEIRAVNWRFRHYELDIVAQFRNMLIIAEVKSRSGTYFQQPFQAVNHKKQKFIIDAANAYIEKFEIDLETRFDILSIVEKNGHFDIEHIEDAFYPRVKK